MTDRILSLWVTAAMAAGSARRHARDRLAEELGEGVISTAIAVLIIALLGAAMWVSFDQLWNGAEARIQDSVNDIGG